MEPLLDTIYNEAYEERLAICLTNGVDVAAAECIAEKCAIEAAKRAAREE